jgi:hypothetical protein
MRDDWRSVGGVVSETSMRTTLSIDDDVLAFARAKAERDGVAIGVVISALARDSLTRTAEERQLAQPRTRNGLPLLSKRGRKPVTLELVNALRDLEP